MHEWPRIKNIDLRSRLEDWELHGIREWAYRFPLSESGEFPISYYLGHRLLEPVSDLFQRQLFLLHTFTEIYKKDTHIAPHFTTTGARYCAQYFAALSGIKEFPFWATYADGQSYKSDQEPTSLVQVFDGSRILHGREGAFQGERAVIPHMCYTDRAWRLRDHSEMIQQGAEVVHNFFERPYWLRKKGTQKLCEFIHSKLIPWHSLWAITDAVVSEHSRVDPSIRKTKIGWIPFNKHPELKAVFQENIQEALPIVAPQFSSVQELNEPNLQYTLYGPEDFYDWHKDGSFDGFKKRRVSVTLLLKNADGGGVFELENVGEIPLQPGDMIIFPSYKRHRVTPITKGKRHSLVGWFEPHEPSPSPPSVV